MPTWSSPLSLKGAPGLSVLTGTAAPSDAIGVDGQTYINTAAGQLYRKSGSTWGSPISLVGPKGDTGPQGGAANLPANISANSVTVAPVANDTKASTLTVKNGTGAAVYNVDGAGNVTAAGNANAAGNASVGGALGVSGGVTGNGFATTATGGASAPAFGITGSFRGTQNAQVSSGTYFNSQYGQMYEVVGGYTSRSQTFASGNPVDLGPGYITHSWATLVSGGNVAYQFGVNGGAALTLNGSGAALFGASLSVGGLATTAGLKLSSGALTFADGTSISTAPAASAPGSSNAFNAQALGTASAPAFAYKATGAGTYFDGNGNVLVAVNGFRSLYSDAASGAAAGANGWAIASTRGAGAMVLSLFGNGGAAATTTVDGAGSITTAGPVKSAGLTLTSGAVTFADGTSQITAATSSAGGSSFYARQYISMGGQYRSSGQNGVLRTSDVVNQQGTSSAGRTTANVQMPSAGSIVGIHVYLGYTTGTQQALTAQVYKNLPEATTGNFMDISVLPANRTYPATPITFAPGTYPFAAGDLIGMSIYTTGTNIFACTAGIYVVYNN